MSTFSNQPTTSYSNTNDNNIPCQGCFDLQSSSIISYSDSLGTATATMTRTINTNEDTGSSSTTSTTFRNPNQQGPPRRSRKQQQQQQQQTKSSHNIQSKSSSIPSNLSTRKKSRSSTPAGDEPSSLLAKELNELTFQERERVYEEVHGVATFIEETPELVNAKIQELHTELTIISRSKRRALDRAFFLRPSLQADEKFLKMFLRADSYDAKLAAQRITLYFTYKLELFGDEKLVKTITLDDMNEDDMDAINTGALFTMKEKDTAGRSIWFIAQKDCKYKHWKNQIRYFWYQVMVTLENDEQAQIRGIIDIIYCVGMSAMEATFSQLISQGGHMLNSLPFRLSALHFCYSDRKLQPALSLIQMMVKRNVRLRFRTHFGSNIEVRYALMTFGIPMGTGTIPITDNDELIPELNQQYLHERRGIESQQKLEREKWEKEISQNSKINKEGEKIYIEYPSPKDVLLGRGRPFQSFTGNQHLVALVEQRRAEYQSIHDRFEKSLISMKIIEHIQSKGGRFLQRVPNHGWEEINDMVARDKVSHTFRTKTNGMTAAMAATTESSLENHESDDQGMTNENKRIRYDGTASINDSDGDDYKDNDDDNGG